MIINAMSCQARPREKADPSLISCPLQLRDRPQTLLRFGHRVLGGQSHLHDHHIQLAGSTAASPKRLLDYSSPWRTLSSQLNTKSRIVSKLTSFALNSLVYQTPLAMSSTIFYRLKGNTEQKQLISYEQLSQDKIIDSHRRKYVQTNFRRNVDDYFLILS